MQYTVIWDSEKKEMRGWLHRINRIEKEMNIFLCPLVHRLKRILQSQAAGRDKNSNRHDCNTNKKIKNKNWKTSKTPRKILQRQEKATTEGQVKETIICRERKKKKPFVIIKTTASRLFSTSTNQGKRKYRICFINKLDLEFLELQGSQHSTWMCWTVGN